MKKNNNPVIPAPSSRRSCGGRKGKAGIPFSFFSFRFSASKRRFVLRIACVLLLGFLSACGGGRGSHYSPKGTPGAAGYYKVGKPYQIKDNWYYPKEDYSYDETGIASWYGADFHELKTANGETYNKNELTAAHKTLPMPSLARVTNLENGRSIVVRVNDRGPFSGARVIDVSQRAAQLLGFERQGTAKVRVQVLADESKAIADAMRSYGGSSTKTTDQIVASAQQAHQPTTSSPFTSSNASVEVMPLDALPPPQPAPTSMTMASVKPVAEYVQLPVTGKNQIFVQAGAFTNSGNAQRLQQSLKKTGVVNVVEALVKGVKYYRVRVGPIDSVALADKTLKKVVGAGAQGARIIVD
ncbi:MAG: septal ring lytic transglycosylase RlpA family protein [Bdellovibrionales bacterium]